MNVDVTTTTISSNASMATESIVQVIESIAERESIRISDDEDWTQPETDEETISESVISDSTAFINTTTNNVSDEEAEAFQRLDTNPVELVNLPRKRPRLEESENDDETMQCSICFDSWTQLGSHRVVSLICGHLFGDSCIRKWLSDKDRSKAARGKCPQCNRRNKRSDIRPIWMQRAIAIDNAEVIEAQREAAEERELRLYIETERARLQSAYKMAMSDLEKAQKEINELKAKVATLNEGVYSTTISSLRTDSLRHDGLSREPSIDSSIRVQCTHEHSIPLCEAGSLRALAMQSSSNMAYVGCQMDTTLTTEQISANFGIVRLQLDTMARDQLACHKQPIRDLATHPIDNLIMSISMDRTMKLSSFDTNTTSVQTFDLGLPGWSCGWHPSNPIYVAAGLANGTILLFDRRRVQSPIERLNGKDWLGTKPVHSLAFLEPTTSGLQLVAASFDKALSWSWEALQSKTVTEGSQQYVFYNAPPGASCYDMSLFCSETDDMRGLFSHRISQPASSLFSIGAITATTADTSTNSEITRDFNLKFNEEQNYTLPCLQKTLTRNTIVSLSDTTQGNSKNVLIACMGRDNDHSIRFLDLSNRKLLSQATLTSLNGSSILSIRHQHYQGQDRLAVMTNTHLHTYQMNLSSF
ncbi:hypothetical protein BDF19DRAFT_445680 [Syncephalis fuscata]|nr:hypothetical protein BDF19DRAFT_445680 [Syncephalis fuscata]